jgi:hypothetical protein
MVYIDAIKGGKYINLWTVNHFLSGVVVVGWVLKLGFNVWLAFLVYFILAIAWEIVEFYLGEFEVLGNKIMDVMSGLIGFWLVYYFIIMQRSLSIYFVISCTVVYLILEILCLIDYRKRHSNF